MTFEKGMFVTYLGTKESGIIIHVSVNSNLITVHWRSGDYPGIYTHSSQYLELCTDVRFIAKAIKEGWVPHE